MVSNALKVIRFEASEGHPKSNACQGFFLDGYDYKGCFFFQNGMHLESILKARVKPQVGRINPKQTQSQRNCESMDGSKSDDSTLGELTTKGSNNGSVFKSNTHGGFVFKI